MFCCRPSHFVRLGECRLNILPQNFFYRLYMTFPVDILILQISLYVLKPKEKSSPYISNVYGSVLQESF